MHATHTPLYLHLVATPLSIEQVAKSRTPPCKKQFMESNLASGKSEHCSVGPIGELNKLLYYDYKIQWNLSIMVINLRSTEKNIGGSTGSSWPSRVVMVIISSWNVNGSKRSKSITKLEEPKNQNNNNKNTPYVNVCNSSMHAHICVHA